MKALVLDTETTGLIENRSIALDKQPCIIEFYGCLADLKKGKVLKEYHTLIKPRVPLKGTLATNSKKGKVKTITDITGIDDAMVSKSPRFNEVADLIFNFIEEAPLVIAQNASFDRDMLEIEAERLGRQIKWPPVICAIEQTVHLKGYRLNLADLHSTLLGKPFSGAHRAKADTLALMRCCTELVKRGML